MALIVDDRVKDTTTSTGTAAITLANSPPTGFVAFSTIGNGNTTYYTIAGQTTNEWEVGIGTYTSSGFQLSRDTVLSNYLGTTALVSFSAGTKDVFCTYPAEKAVYQGNDNTVIPGDSGAIYLATQTVSVNTTIPSGYNGMVPAALTVANGVTLTVPNGSTVVVVA